MGQTLNQSKEENLVRSHQKACLDIKHEQFTLGFYRFKVFKINKYFYFHKLKVVFEYISSPKVNLKSFGVQNMPMDLDYPQH
jgi:hypothetical protein